MSDPADRYEVFSYLTVEKADRYRRVMTAFTTAKARFRIHLRPAEVLELLEEADGAGREEIDRNEIQALLGQLVAWGNLRADVDHAEVATVEEFYRPRHLYQLTPEGEAAERALAWFEETLGTPGELQATALSDILGLLRELSALAGDPKSDGAKVHLTLRTLFDRFQELTDRAQTFISGLQRTVDLHGVDLDAFLLYKDRLVEYLERFIGELTLVQSQIAAVLLDLREAGADRLLRIAAGRDLEDALEVDEALQATARAHWERRWQGLNGWFLAPDGGQPHAEILRGRAREAIPALLRAVHDINERRISRTDRPADLRCLARWFAAAPSDADAHRLWRAAFGLTPARHLLVDEETLDARDRRPLAPSTSWLHDEPLRISPRLRRTGHYIRRGRPNSIIDRTQGKAFLEEAAAREAAELAKARRRLVTEGRIRLSELGELDRDAFGLFLDLLGEALARKARPDELVRAFTADGSLEILLVPTSDGRTATIRTAWGELHGPDHEVEIVDRLEEAGAAETELAGTAPEQAGAAEVEPAEAAPEQAGATEPEPARTRP